MNEGFTVADALALRNSGNENCNGFGNDGWWIILLILFAAGGWGRGGLGFGGGAEGITPCCTPATAQGVSDAFNFNQLDNGLRGIQNGLCDGFYAQNSAISNGFHGVDNAICNRARSTYLEL